MIAVIFEVTMRAGQADRYFDLAEALRGDLAGVDGFISVERFESVSTPGKYVSLSFWRDEQAVKTWRRHADHQSAQRLGKDEIFADFKITVTEVRRSYTLAERRSENKVAVTR